MNKIEIKCCEKNYIPITLNTTAPPLYLYKPKEDITVYELALITPILILSSYSLDANSIEQQIKNLPENAQRHFEEQ